MDWKGIRCLVTGGAGFIGSHVTEALSRQGAKVRVVDDLSRGRLSNIQSYISGVELLKGDLANPEIVSKSVEDVDYCFHLGATVGGVEFMKTHPAVMFGNSVIDHNILEACRNSKMGKILYMSSACVYPINLQTSASPAPLKEDDALRNGASPDGAYGWAKLVGELQFNAYRDEFGLDISIVRPFNPYGPRESFDPKDSHVIPALIRRAVKNEDPFVVWGDGSQERDFIYISDVVEGVIAAMEAPDGGPFNLASGSGCSVKTIVELVLELTNRHPRIVWQASGPTSVASRTADISRASARLNWKPKVGLRDGLAQTIDWYRTISS